MKGAEHLLDGYATRGKPKTVMKDGVQYAVQYYQGEHKNEFTLRSPLGNVFLYENNVLKQQWKEIENDKKVGEFIRYKNGRVDFFQRFQDILDQTNWNRISNHKKGLRMEIWSVKTGHLLYHGEFNNKRQKEGWGIEYDEESGNVVVEGMWRKGALIEVIRCFNGDVMTELKRNGSDSLDPVKRIPMYVGGFRYDEENETFVREGKGCLIDAKSGIATRECEWKDGVEVSGVDLNDGWYNPFCVEITIKEPKELENVRFEMTDLKISSNSCNDVKELDLKRFEWLQSIEIGNDCFESMQTFQIDGINRLKSLKIGKNSFTQKKNTWGDDKSKSFHILNCESLESIQIGEYSFNDFGGELELKNLPQLHSIQIGLMGSDSYNFYSSTFLIRGIELILNIVMIRSSKSTIHCDRKIGFPTNSIDHN